MSFKMVMLSLVIVTKTQIQGQDKWSLYCKVTLYFLHEILTHYRWVPVYADQEQNLAVMSIGFLLKSKNDAVVWRGPKKHGIFT